MRLDERGRQCPLPVVEAKKALEASQAGEIVEVVVDNEIAVQNLRKLADHRGLASRYEKINDREYLVEITAGGAVAAAPQTAGQQASEPGNEAGAGAETQEGDISCQPDSRRKGVVAVLSSNLMGQGDEALGKLLMKGFVYALTQQDVLPEIVLMYNSGAYLSCEGSDSLEDLKSLEAQGTEVLTCGTCLNHYGLGGKLLVGGVTNMYEIVERMTGASLLVRP